MWAAPRGSLSSIHSQVCVRQAQQRRGYVLGNIRSIPGLEYLLVKSIHSVLLIDSIVVEHLQCATHMDTL